VIVSTANPYRLYVLEGKVPGKWDELLISSHVGAVAPHSMLTIEDAIRHFSTDTIVHAVIFLSHDGIYMTDGQTVSCISHTISDYWDTENAPYIEPGYANLAYAWLDYEDKTVHFAVPINTTGTGEQTTLNRELVYNYISDEWYGLYTRANALACGNLVLGNNTREKFAYGGDYSGYVYRLNYGTTDTGSAIEYYVKTSDVSPLEGVQNDAFNYSAQLRKIKVKGESGTTGNCEVTVFLDGATTATSSTTNTISMVNSGYAYWKGKLDLQEEMKGESFAFKFRSGVTETGADGSFLGYTLDFFPVRETQ